MRFFDYIKTAFRNLKRQKLRTFLTVIAIVIGSLSVIIMLSLVIGVRRVMINQLESIGGLTLVTVTGSDNMEGGGDLLSSGNGGDNSDGKKLDDTVLAEFKSIENVSSATPVANIWAKSMKLEGQEKRTWANTLAYDIESNVFQVPIIHGRALEKGDMDKIVVGVETLKAFGYKDRPAEAVGKNMIFIMDGYNTPDWGPLPEKPPTNANKEWWDEQGKIQKEVKAEIVGVTSGGTDSRQNFITLDWARKMQTQVRWEWDEEANKNCQGDECKNMDVQKLVKEDMILKNGYGSIILKADNTKNVKAIGEEIKKDGYGVTTAEEMLDEITKIFTTVGIVAGVIGGISLFVAAIGIINTMIMATYERTREIGVMRACGATRAAIRRLFTIEASLLGFFGGVIGLIVSYLLSLLGNFIADKIATSESIPISGIITFPIWLIIGVVVFTTIIGLLSGLYPAHRAAKLDPVEALRYE